LTGEKAARFERLVDEDSGQAFLYTH
jgi:hypothetical protein